MLWVRKKKIILQKKSCKRLERWFSLRSCVASKQKHILLNAKLDNCPAVTTAKSNTRATGNEVFSVDMVPGRSI